MLTAGIRLVSPGRDGQPLLEEAVSLLEECGARLELARARIDLGGMLRRANRRAAARRPLADGLQIAEECGAAPLVATARAELEACGVRVRGPRFSGADALTPSERRVALMAADGMANREIAQALFVTSRTVESHVARAFMKLGIHARTEIRAALERQ